MPHLGQRFIPAFRMRKPDDFIAPSYFGGRRHSILAIIKFNEQSYVFSRTAVSLASRLGMDVELFHVCPAPSAEIISHDPSLSDSLADEIRQEFYDSMTSHAERKLRDLKTLVKGACQITYEVAIGRPLEQILRAAQSPDMALIMTDTDRASPSDWQPSQTTSSLTDLVAESPLPVLIVPEGNHPEVLSASPTLLLVDDLSRPTMAAVAASWELARALGARQLMHVHVLKRSIVPRKWPLGEDESRRLSERLQERLGFLRDALSGTGINYARRIAIGDSVTDIAKLMEETQPDMVIVGRHAAWMSRHANLWKMLTNFLSLGNVPILVVPPSPPQSYQH